MNDYYRLVNKHLIYPLYYWKNSDRRLTRLDELEKNQYLSLSELKALQLKRLQKMIHYAFEHTVYYKALLLEHQLTPNDFKTLDDIEKLPFLTKTLLQKNQTKMLSKAYLPTELIKDSSGGSTGEPTIFYKNSERHHLRRADQIRHDRWSGWDIGQRKALIWGAQRDLKASPSYREFIFSRYVDRQWELDAFEMSAQKMHAFTKKLEHLQPSMILGYANALTLYAEYILETHPHHDIRPKGIISSAETLTENKRALIEKAFHCPVLNRYGSREVGLIASECKKRQGLHMNADNLLIEVVDSLGKPIRKGQGEIVITDFWNFGMPMIRYKVGDIGVIESKNQCDCGRILPLIKRIEGRCSDFFIHPKGHKIHGEYFTHLFYEQKKVKQFQMIQKSFTCIHLKIVETSPQVDQDYLIPIVEQIKKILGNEVKVNIEILSSISKSPTGKFLFTISQIMETNECLH
jgi:phenylacetate-CoA ligase